MQRKPKPTPPLGRPQADAAARPPTTATIARPAPDRRWQRTARFIWDKGGSKGGRK